MEDLLYRLTFLDEAIIKEAVQESHKAPEKRIGQTLLAQTVVEMVHGDRAIKSVQGSTSAFFSADIESICSMNESEFMRHFEHTKIVELS